MKLKQHCGQTNQGQTVKKLVRPGVWSDQSIIFNFNFKYIKQILKFR